MASVFPIGENTFRKTNMESDSKDSVSTKYQQSELQSGLSETNDTKPISRLFISHATNPDTQNGAKKKSNSAGDILDDSRKNGKTKKSKKRDRSKRSQTITYVAEEAEHVFDAFCSTDKTRSNSAPNSFNVKIDRNIGEEKMKKLKKFIKNTSDSEHETDKLTILKTRKKKSFFKRIKERLMVLNKKQPLMERSQKIQDQEREKELQKQKEAKKKLTRNFFESFRNSKKKSKGFHGTLGKKDSDNYTNQSTDDPLDRSGNSVFSDKSGRGIVNLDLKNVGHDLPTPTSMSYPFSPFLVPQDEEGKTENTEIDNNEGTASKNSNFSNPSQSQSRGHPYLAFFDSAGSSVDFRRGLGRLEGLPEMKFIDEDIDEDEGEGEGTTFTNACQKATGSSHYDKTAILHSSVDSREVSMSSLGDSGCEDVVDKYAQVAKLLDKISQDVNEELKGTILESDLSALELARQLASKDTYQSYQSQLNELLQQLNEPLLNQVALLFSVTRSAIDLVGFNTENAVRIKDYLMRYYTSHFALQVASEGGLESLTEDSDK